MIDLYYWTTPNGHKVTIMLEETGLAYTVKPVNINAGEQFDPAFLAIAPNNRIPAIVDHAPAGGGAPLPLFESGAILAYLAEKTGRFLPCDLAGRWDCLQWLFWQMANLGPMAGQTHHFRNYAQEKVPYAIDRYVRETGRLYAVLDKRLADREYVAGPYTIADMACYPWILPERQGQEIDRFPHLKAWKARIAARPAVERAYALAKSVNPTPAPMDEKARQILFGQSAGTIR
jgi:GST-like protein